VLQGYLRALAEYSVNVKKYQHPGRASPWGRTGQIKRLALKKLTYPIPINDSRFDETADDKIERADVG
jgi:hypothetical protein